MAAWSDGYVADIPYTHGYFRRMAPSHVRLSALIAGHAGPEGDGVAYAELGCGQGFGALLIAAANPDASVYGFDFNPEQTGHARRLAAAAGLANATFEDISFEELAERPRGELPDFDVITLHGVYSWITPGARAAIAAFIRRKLKPGGLVYVSYNAMPGCASVMPLRRLLRDEAARASGTSDRRATAALAAAQDLADKGFRFFAENQSVTRRLEQHKNQSPAYLAHEYLNEHWVPFYLADVAAELEAGKLAFVGSARLVENDLRLAVPGKLHDFLAAVDDPIRREGLKDYLTNRPFRVDVFQKGRMRPGNVEIGRRVRAQRLALARDPGSVDLAFKTAAGGFEGKAEVFAPLIDRLGRSPAAIGELEDVMRGKMDFATLLRIILLLDNTDQIATARLAPADPQPARRLNRAIAAQWSGPYRFVASPELGGGTEASADDLLFLDLVLDGSDTTVPALAAAARDRLLASRKVVREGGEAVTDLQEQMAVILKRAEHFVSTTLPVWRRLAILPANREAALPRMAAAS